MLRQARYAALALLLLLSAAFTTTANPVDLVMVAKIREEGLHSPRVMDFDS